MVIHKRYYLYGFFFLLVGLAFTHNGSISLWDQDEAAYAGFAKNMVESGDWVIPNFTWSKIHRKPPLHFWNIALSYKVFGINEFSVRFPSALCIIFLYLVVYFWGRKLFEDRTAFLSTVVLSTTLFVPILAKVSVTDATLLFFSTLCAFSILQVLQQKSNVSVLVFWTSFALALLTKGPPIIIFCAVFGGMLFIIHPNRKKLLQFHPWFFLPLAVMPLIMWGYLTTKEDNGEFIYWMIDWYILKRFNGSVLGQSGPPGTHLLLITAFFIPYLMFFPEAIWKGISGIWKKDHENLFLGAWFVSGWLIYEFSPSKLPAYSVVAHVPLALLIGKIMVTHFRENTSPHKGLIILQFSIQMILITALLAGSIFMELSEGLKWSLILFNLVMIIGVVLTYRLPKSVNFTYSLLGINLLFQFFIHIILLPQIDGYKNSTQKVSNFIAENAIKESTIILSNQTGHPPSLPFYTSLHFDQVIVEDKFDQLATFYKSNTPYVFVLNKSQKDLFSRDFQGVDFQEIGSFLTDRKKQLDYYILMNKAGKAND